MKVACGFEGELIQLDSVQNVIKIDVHKWYSEHMLLGHTNDFNPLMA